MTGTRRGRHRTSRWRSSRCCALEPGDIVTYGEVALEAGYLGRARAVGRILARSGGEHPWWRVVAASGRLVPGHEPEQARRLEAEGVAVDLERGRVRRVRTGAGEEDR
ncbi:MAG: MGMT family protein [Acidimicrobiales bacterium]